MNQFTASNGITIEARDGALISKWPNTHDHLKISVGDTEALREFFRAEAELEASPWLAAQHDEVWVLTTPALGERAYQVVRTEEAGFRFFLIADVEGFRPGLFPYEKQITAGRRIYPEVTE